MLELERKLIDLIDWIVKTYGITKDEAIKSIVKKVVEL